MPYTPTPNRPDLAEKNRLGILAALRMDGFAQLPPGTTYIDEYLLLTPEFSGCTLAGAGMAASMLKQIGQPWPRMGGVVILGPDVTDPGPTEFTVEEGSLTVPSTVAPKLGAWVYVGDGRALAAEFRGEWRRVVSADGQSLTMDRPLRRVYAGVRVLTGTPVTGITLRDLTIAQPEHAGVYKLLAKFAVGLHCERVRFGLPGDPPAGWGTGSCGHIRLLDCESPGAPLGLNTTHDITIRGGRYQSIVGEEACTDADVMDVLIVPGGQPQPGLKWYYGCDRLRARNVRIEGGGAVAAEGGTHSPLGVWGRQCRLVDVETAHSLFTPGLSGCGLGGDGLVVSNCRCDLETWVTDGRDIQLRDSAAPHWECLPETVGWMRDCEGTFRAPPEWRSNWTQFTGATGNVNPEAVRFWQERRVPFLPEMLS